MHFAFSAPHFIVSREHCAPPYGGCPSVYFDLLLSMRERTSPKRIALVTGGSTGIGAACVRQFLQRGWKVSVLAPPSLELERLSGPKVLTIPGDITVEQDRFQVIEKTLARFHRIDVLVNNAGVGLYGLPSAVPIDLFSRALQVNVVGALALTQSVIPVMRKLGSGTIVNVVSVAGRVSLPWAAAYSATKFALDGIHDSLRRELRHDRIHLVKVYPGIVSTKFRDNVLGGMAPPAVSAIRWTVSADKVARRIWEGIEYRRNTVYVPWIARWFTLLETVAPSLMDLYLARFLHTEGSLEEHVSSMQEHVSMNYRRDLSSHR
jgi:short-subunit dehydrogenase